MKRLIPILSIVVLCLSACKEETKLSSSEPIPEEVVKIEKELENIEHQTKKVEEAETELDNALEELDF